MDVVSTCPIRVASRVWPPMRGAWSLIVVCKATYLLAPGESPLHADQEPPNEEDTHWDDDPGRSLSSSSDLVPFKPRADVVLVGSAFSPGGRQVRSIVARLIVAGIDKSIEAFCPRAFAQSGELVEGTRVAQVPLRYERAAGGPGTWNPVGVRQDADPDSYGMVAVANLQAPGLHVAHRGDFIEPAGFGPIAPSWPTRAQRVGPSASGWVPERWHDRPLPAGFDPAFFNAAPRDQQASELRSNERLVLENLHRDHPRLATSLPGISPSAVVEREGGLREPVALAPDTLSIDTARGVCAMVWRGWVPLSHPDEGGRVVVSIEGPGAAAVADSPAAEAKATGPMSPHAGKGPATPFQGAIVLDAAAAGTKDTSPLLPQAGRGPATPFGGSIVLDAPAVDPKATWPASPQAGRGPATPFASPWPAPPLIEPAVPMSPKLRAAASGTLVGAPADSAFREALPFRPGSSPDLGPPLPPAPAPPPAPVPAPIFGRALVALGHEQAPAGPPRLGPLAPETPAAPPAEPRAAPEPPPMVGPLAKVEMPEREEEADSATADEEGDTIPPPAPAEALPEREPEPGDFPIERCAALTAAIAMARPETAKILEAEELTGERWEAITKHWDDAIREERARGKNALLKVFDAAYVGSVEERRGAIRMEEYARLAVASERGTAAAAAYELGLPRGAPMRIERAWAARMVKDPAFGRRVREAIAKEREG